MSYVKSSAWSPAQRKCSVSVNNYYYFILISNPMSFQLVCLINKSSVCPLHAGCGCDRRANALKGTTLRPAPGSTIKAPVFPTRLKYQGLCTPPSLGQRKTLIQLPSSTSQPACPIYGKGLGPTSRTSSGSWGLGVGGWEPGQGFPGRP